MNNSTKKLLITGGCSGIGKELVNFFKDKNYQIAIFDKVARSSENENNLTAKDIKLIYCDVSDDDSVAKACNKLFESSFHPDILINNAGIIHNEPLVNFLKKDDRLHSRESWDNVISTNLSSVFFVTSRVVELMLKERKRGVIISISSICSKGNKGQTAYSAAKAGVNALTKTWSKELGPLGIRFVSISPGFLDTPSTHKSLNEKQIDNLKKLIPLKKFGDPISIAQTSELIIKNEYINGTTIEVDGGLVI